MNRVLGSLLGSITISSVLITPAAAVDEDVAVQLLQRLNHLEQEVKTLRGKNEELLNELDAVRKNQRNGFLQVDERVQKLEGGESPVSAPAANASVPAPASTPTAAVATAAPAVNANTQSESSGAQASIASVVSSIEIPEPDIDLSQSDSFYYYGTGDKQPEGAGANKNVTTAASEASRQSVLTGDQAVTAQNTVITDNGKSNAQPTTPAEPVSTDPELAARNAYNNAYKKLLSDPVTAVPAFQDFLRRYPNHLLSANAQYWIGEAMYAQGNYSRATEEFMKVLKQYKESSKAPDAALKLGYSFYELKQWDFARRTLEDTTRFFPDTNAARLAAIRLEQMTSQGR